ncbi:MAG TPA: hypothetical protein VNZ57_10945 [Longimicrobiales bacterium]|nr:hypothetical protein [Longimicrobiales bacterium]
MRLSTRVTLAVASLAMASCAEEPQADRPGWFEQEAAGLIEEMRIRGGEHGLTTIDAVAVREDGALAILQRQSAAIRLFTAAGGPVATLGGASTPESPFINPSHLGWWGDTLWVFDYARRQLSIIGPDLIIAATIDNAPTGLMSVTPDRRAVGTRFLDGRSVLAATDLTTGTSTVIVELPPRADEAPDGRGGSAVVDLSPQYAVSPGGERLAIAVVTGSGTGTGDFHLTVVDAAGDTAFAASYPLGGVDESFPPPAALDGSVPPPPAAVDGESVGAARANSAASYPPLAGVVVGRDGSVWLERTAMDGERAYLVVGAGGGTLGRVVIPTGSRVVAAAADHAWIVESSVSGANDLVRYRIQWN